MEVDRSWNPAVHQTATLRHTSYLYEGDVGYSANVVVIHHSDLYGNGFIFIHAF